MVILESIQNYFMSTKMIWSVFAVLLLMLTWNLTRKFFLKVIHQNGITGKKANNLRMAMGIIKYSIFSIGGMIILEINGINVTAIIASIGVASVILGVALQDMLKDIIMGANILMDDFFSVGDIVSYQHIEIGEIVSFSLKETRIYNMKTGNTVIVSNRNISEITKVSDWQIIEVPAPYGESVERIRSVCLMICEEAEKHGKIRSCEYLGTAELKHSYISCCLKVSSAPIDKLEVNRAVLDIIQEVFEEQKMNIPFEQLDVHIVK